MSPTAWTPTVPDEAVLRFLDQYCGRVLSGDVGPLLGQAALLAGERAADGATGALLQHAMRVALADAALPQIGGVEFPQVAARSSTLDVMEWLNGMGASPRPERQRVTP